MYKRIILAVITICVVAGLVRLVRSQAASQAPAYIGVPVDDQKAMRHHGVYGSGSVTPADLLLVRGEGGVVTLPQDVGDRELEALRRTTSTFLQAYMSGTLDEYTAVLTTMGLKPHPAIRDDPARWETDRDPFVAAPLDPEKARLIVRSNGRDVTQGRGTGMTMFRNRGVDFPELDPVANRLTSVEAVVPVRARNRHGGTFDARLGVTFVFDTSTRTWRHWSVTLYDLPMGVSFPAMVL